MFIGIAQYAKSVWKYGKGDEESGELVGGIGDSLCSYK
jgi:hypothetical protein